MVQTKENVLQGAGKKTQRLDTRMLVNLALLSTLSYLSVRLIDIPVVSFLSYEPKDIFVALAGFLYGPMATVLIAVVVSFLEMVTFSTTGVIGFLMNVISTVAFAGSAAVLYKYRRTLMGAVGGLSLGVVLSTGLMLLWNYLITPLYMGVPRAVVAEMLVPVFLPFNLIKAGLNAALTMLCYKPFVKLLRMANLSTASAQEQPVPKRKRGFAVLVSLFIVATCVYFILVLRGIL